MTVEWDGRGAPAAAAAALPQEPDRAVRERAFRAAAGPYIERARRAGRALRPHVRAAAAGRRANAGFANFRDYVFPAKYRFDYTPADCERFHDAVEAAVVPAVERMLARRRERLGLDALRPWDLAVDPYRQRAAPARSPTATSSSGGRRAVFDRVDPALGAEFRTMIDERLLDLDSRQGQGAGRLLRHAPLPRAAVHLHERRRAAWTT